MNYNFLSLLENMYNISKSHTMVGDVEIGVQPETNINENIKFVYVFVEIPEIINSINNAETYSLAVQVLDKALEGSNNLNYGPNYNRLEILNKTKEIARDLYAKYIQTLSEECYDTITFSDTMSYTPIIDQYPDRIVGWRIEFTATLNVLERNDCFISTI